MNRFWSNGSVVAAGLLALELSAAGAAPKLNVLFIISDDLRASALGCYGDPQAKSPHLDRLAERSVRFERAYVQYPVCNPSRTSWFSGLRAEQTRIVDNNTFFRTRLPETVMLPELFRRNGWFTAAYGKVFHGPVSPGDKRDWSDAARCWDEAQRFDPTPAAKILSGRNLTGGKLNWCVWGATAGSDDDLPDGQAARRAIATIEQCSAKGTPWFVSVGFERPHNPFLAPKPYYDLYPPGSLKLYRDPPDITPAPRLAIPTGPMREAFEAFSDTERLEFLHAYYAGVSFMDTQVGRLLAALDRLKLWDRTVVVFIGDNGYHLNERNWWNKATLFERSCRVPLFIAAPGAKAGRACRALVELVDLYPTLIEYCGLKPPHRLSGESLRPLLKAPQSTRPDAAYSLVVRGRYSGQTVRTERWRYTQWSDGTAELYDEQSDPEETRNVANSPANAAVLQELRALLKKVGPYEPTDRAGAQRSERPSRAMSRAR